MPLDRGNWCRAKVYTDSPWLTEIADIQEEKQREWTGAQNRTSLIELSRQVPARCCSPGDTRLRILELPLHS